MFRRLSWTISASKFSIKISEFLRYCVKNLSHSIAIQLLAIFHLCLEIHLVLRENLLKNEAFITFPPNCTQFRKNLAVLFFLAYVESPCDIDMFDYW